MIEKLKRENRKLKRQNEALRSEVDQQSKCLHAVGEAGDKLVHHGHTLRKAMRKYECVVEDVIKGRSIERQTVCTRKGTYKVCFSVF